MTATLVLTGGRGHPASATADELAGLLGDPCTVVDDLDDGWSRLAASGADDLDLLVVNALAFDMADDRYDDADRAAHAYRIPPAGRGAIDGWIAAGRPLLVLHTGLVSFGDWDGWRRTVGGAWEWGRSSHPPVGPIEVAVTAPDLGTWVFTVTDEDYRDLWVADDVDVVATSAGQPVAWRRTTATGARVAASTLGHDATSFAEVGHRRLIRSLVDWLLEDR